MCGSVHLCCVAETAGDRKFDPETRYPTGIDPDHIEKYHGTWTNVSCHEPCSDCGLLAAHSDCLVIAVDGACRNIARPSVVASVGVFVGYGSQHNVALCLDWVAPRNNLVAELWACWHGLVQALHIAHQWVAEGQQPLRQIVIKANSGYLVKGMTEQIWTWRDNGYLNNKGKPMVNGDMFRALENLIGNLNELGVHVLFWRVSERRNQLADKLANEALDNAGC